VKQSIIIAAAFLELAMTIAAAQFGMIDCADARSSSDLSPVDKLPSGSTHRR
jgi:hypothetical protein